MLQLRIVLAEIHAKCVILQTATKHDKNRLTFRHTWIYS